MDAEEEAESTQRSVHECRNSPGVYSAGAAERTREHKRTEIYSHAACAVHIYCA